MTFFPMAMSCNVAHVEEVIMDATSFDEGTLQGAISSSIRGASLRARILLVFFFCKSMYENYWPEVRYCLSFFFEDEYDAC